MVTFASSVVQTLCRYCHVVVIFWLFRGAMEGKNKTEKSEHSICSA